MVELHNSEENRKEVISIIKEFKKDIEKLYNEKLIKIFLYGSWARREHTENSDIDLAVLLRGEIVPGREIDNMIDVINEINLKYDVLLSILPLSDLKFTKLRSPLYLNIKKEGIQI